MPYVPIQPTFFRHRKTRGLVLRLGANAESYLIRLWAGCVEQARNGDLSEFDIGFVEELAGWVGPAGAFVKALVEVGFLDWPDGKKIEEANPTDRITGLELHDWYEWCGNGLYQYLKNNHQTVSPEDFGSNLRSAEAKRKPCLSNAFVGEERKGKERERKEQGGGEEARGRARTAPAEPQKNSQEYEKPGKAVGGGGDHAADLLEYMVGEIEKKRRAKPKLKRIKGGGSAEVVNIRERLAEGVSELNCCRAFDRWLRDGEEAGVSFLEFTRHPEAFLDKRPSADGYKDNRKYRRDRKCSSAEAFNAECNVTPEMLERAAKFTEEEVAEQSKTRARTAPVHVPSWDGVFRRGSSAGDDDTDGYSVDSIKDNRAIPLKGRLGG